MEQIEKDKLIETYKKYLELIDKKESVIYFYAYDTKDKPLTSIKYIYDCVKALNELGYNACIFHDKDYTGVKNWLGVEYTNLPHVCFNDKSKKISIKPIDILVIPEMIAGLLKIIEKEGKLPCRKVVLCQNYEYMLEPLQPAETWESIGFDDVIVTSDILGKEVQKNFPLIKYYVVPVGISSELFHKTTLPKNPSVAILCRNKYSYETIIKSFYLRFPYLRWVTFEMLDSLKPEMYAEIIGHSSLLVWVDEISGFGTAPIEAMKCGTQVLAKVPNLIPEWALDSDGELTKDVKWFYNILDLPNLISDFMVKLIQDNIVLDEALADKYEKLYSHEAQKEAIKNYIQSALAIQSEKLNKAIKNLE